MKRNIKKLFTLVQKLKNNQTVAVLLPTHYTLFLLSNIAIILYFVNFYRHVVHHEKKEKIANVCFFILCIYILLFHGNHKKDFPSLSLFNPSIHHPFITTSRSLTFYLIAFPPSIPDSREYFMHMFKQCSIRIFTLVSFRDI